jgi:Tol biopolymer transport system component
MRRGLAWLGVMIFATSLVRADGDEASAIVERMARVGSCSSPSFSPDGQRLAFVSDLSGVPQVWTIAAQGGWPEAVTAFDDPVGSVAWSPDGSKLAFTLAPGGGMNSQIYIVRPDGTGLKRLTDGGKAANRFGRWSRDGRSLLVASNRRTSASMDAFLVDAEDGAWRHVAELGGIGGLTDLSRDGQKAVLDRLAQRGNNNLFLIGLDGGPERLLTPHEGPGSFFGAAFSPDGRTIYLASNQGRDRTAFARVRLGDDGTPVAIEVISARADAELSILEVNEQGTTAALIWNAAGRSQLALVDLASGESKPGPALPAEVAGGLAFSRDGRHLALVLSGSAAPSDLWSWRASRSIPNCSPPVQTCTES